MRIKAEDYVARIANASQLQLVVINYEIILDYIKAARLSINDKVDFQFDIEKARQFLNELRCSLNMEYKISKYLMNLYVYIDQQLAYCYFDKKEEHLDEAEKILNTLLEGWSKVEEEENDKTPIMANTEQLYAGLTYGKNGSLNEYVNVDSKRGFKA